MPPLGERPKHAVAPAEEAELRGALSEVAAGRFVDLTPDELAAWERTGDLPASVVARLASLECNESPG